MTATMKSAILDLAAHGRANAWTMGGPEMTDYAARQGLGGVLATVRAALNRDDLDDDELSPAYAARMVEYAERMAIAKAATARAANG